MSTKQNLNQMRDLMLTTIEISRRSKVPMLYLGNPGVGKTTIIDMYAEQNGYHVESVIGSSFDRSEILGYMVNDGVGTDHLVTKMPEWFWRIQQKEKEGIPSILFIDEIPTTPKDVQGSLYRLIFERTIGNGMKLPEDCIIISAGNYKGNLPLMCDVTSPNINRFCIINFLAKSFKSLYEEVLMQEEEDLSKDLPVFPKMEITEEFLQKTKDSLLHIFEEIDDAYSQSDSSKGELNVNNTILNNIFDADYSEGTAVYNFISKRTISYFRACFRAMASMQLKDKDVIHQVVDGLIGLGFNSFTEIKELNTYRKFVHSLTTKALKEVITGQKEKEKTFSDNAKTITEKVESISLELDSLTNSNLKEYIADTFQQILQEYPIDESGALQKLESAPNSQLRLEVSSIEKLIKLTEDYLKDDTQKPVVLDLLNHIVQKYKFYALTSL